jgi:hypothetical protein
MIVASFNETKWLPNHDDEFHFKAEINSNDLFEISPNDDFFKKKEIHDSRGMYIIGVHSHYENISYSLHIETMNNKIRTVREDEHNIVRSWNEEEIVKFRYFHTEDINFDLELDIEVGSTAEIWVSNHEGSL